LCENTYFELADDRELSGGLLVKLGEEAPKLNLFTFSGCSSIAIFSCERVSGHDQGAKVTIIYKKLNYCAKPEILIRILIRTGGPWRPKIGQLDIILFIIYVTEQFQ
jgi:hypothetical protein